jgi:hypothetical protein
MIVTRAGTAAHQAAVPHALCTDCPMMSAMAGLRHLPGQRSFGKLAPDDRGERVRAERQRILHRGRRHDAAARDFEARWYAARCT